MQPKELQIASLNAVVRKADHYSIGVGDIWYMPEHPFSQNVFYYILDGRCTIQVEGKEYIGIPGRWFFIPAGTPYGWKNDTSRPFSKYWFHFDLLPRNLDLFSGSQVPLYVDVEPDSTAFRLFEAFGQYVKGNTLMDKLQIKSILLSLLCEYVRLAAPEISSAPIGLDAPSKKLMNYIPINLDQDLSNAVLAAYMHMSVRSFLRYFKNLTGQTPAAYIAQVRMEVAKSLLEESSLSVSEIMDRVGVSSVSSFSKMFKKHYGYSPRTYRELFRKSV